MDNKNSNATPLSTEEEKEKGLRPDLGFWKLWNISFGFFGVQIAYALQSANISRIFSTLGADPHNLSYFWILPPLVGIIVQPIVGAASDRTWTRFGRRIPYLFIGSLIAVLVMCLLPNAGSFGMAVGTAMIFGLFSLMLLDTSINMAMQPFKMMVGDMVNEKQKGLAYSIQSFLCNAGSLVGYLFPFIFTWVGISNIAPQGVIPDSVIYSFYIGAAILILCVIYTSMKVKEMPPAEYARYHGITEEEKTEKTNMLKLLVKAPKAFWTVGLVQFFCWFAFMFMWTYTNGSVAANVFDAPTVETLVNGVSKVVLDTKSVQYQNAADWVGVLFAVQAIGSVLWAIIIPLFKNRKFIYSLSLILGGVGFISTYFVHNQYLLFISFLLVGCAWAAMLALPFTILTNALSGSRMGTYLGLFNGTICIPQIVAAALGGSILMLYTPNGTLPPEINMLVTAGIMLIIGAICVYLIKETSGEHPHK
jgi:maltose/moltooligosaccharide transporter